MAKCTACKSLSNAITRVSICDLLPTRFFPFSVQDFLVGKQCFWPGPVLRKTVSLSRMHAYT